MSGHTWLQFACHLLFWLQQSKGAFACYKHMATHYHMSTSKFRHVCCSQNLLFRLWILTLQPSQPMQAAVDQSCQMYGSQPGKTLRVCHEVLTRSALKACTRILFSRSNISNLSTNKLAVHQHVTQRTYENVLAKDKQTLFKAVHWGLHCRKEPRNPTRIPQDVMNNRA